MQFWLRTKTGPVEVSRDKIEQLRQAGKLTDHMRVVSTDGGQTWLTYRETVNVPQRQDASVASLASLAADAETQPKSQPGPAISSGSSARPANRRQASQSAMTHDPRRATTGQKKCFKCKALISKAAKHCPHCNTRQVSPWIGLGCLGVMMVLVLVLIGVYASMESDGPAGNQTPRTYSSANRERQWYQGGTLHHATVDQWRRASYRNKLATAADWLSATLWRGHLHSTRDFDRLKGKARILVIAVDAAVVGVDPGHDIANVAAVLLVTMGDDLAP